MSYSSQARGPASPQPPGRVTRATARSASTGTALPRPQASLGLPGPTYTPTAASIGGRDLPPHMLRALGRSTPREAASPGLRAPGGDAGTTSPTSGTPGREQPPVSSAAVRGAGSSGDSDQGAFSETAEGDNRTTTAHTIGQEEGTIVYREASPDSRRGVRLTSQPAPDSDDDSNWSHEQVDRLLRMARTQTEERMQAVVEDTEKRFRSEAADRERRMQAMEATTARILQLLEPTSAARQAATPDLHRRARTKERAADNRRVPSPRRRARFSGASQLMFGNEETPLLSRATSSHKGSGTGRGKDSPNDESDDSPSDDHDEDPSSDSSRSGRDRRAPRRKFKPKAEDLGKFDPSKDFVYNWWLGVVNYMEYTGSSTREIFSGFPGCFEGDAKNWFNRLIPRPQTLEEFRIKIFEAYARDELLVREDLEARRFDPDSEKLETYLTDKLNLVSELHVSRGVSRGTLRLQPFKLEALMTKETVADAIATVHAGLPADWALFLEPIKDAARDWTDYRTKMVGKEGRTRSAVSLLTQRVAAAATTKTSGRTRTTRTSAQPVAEQTATPTSHQRPAVAATHSTPARSRDMTDEQQAARRLDRQLGRCFHCHEPGHPERDCPRLRSAIQTVKRVLTTLEEGASRDEVSILVRLVERDMTTSLSPHAARTTPLTDEESDEDDDVPTRIARAVLVSPDGTDPVDYAPSKKDDLRTVQVPGRRHRGVVAHKVAVLVGRGRDQVELHVDGGSPLSMITRRALRTIAPEAPLLPPEPLKIRGYRGDDFQSPSAVVILPVSFPTSNGTPAVDHKFEFHVVDECSGGWLLGVDNMKADGIDALSKREVLVFEKRPDAVVRLLQSDVEQDRVSSPGRLVCAQSIKLQPRTVHVVPIDPVSEDSVVNPWWFTHEEAPSGFVKVPSCIVGAETRGVEISNNSDSVVELREGDVLGTTEPLERQLGTLEELVESVERLRSERRAGRRQAVVRALKAWMRRDTRDSTPWSLAPTRRARRLTITRAESDGGDVLPEIDVPRPPDNEQVVTCSDRLSPDQQKRLIHVLRAHAVWPTKKRPLGLYEYGPVSLRLKSGREEWTHVEPPRRTSPAQKSVIDETLREHDALGISEPSQGPYASGVVLVQQRDKIRFCNDYRPLNRVTEDHHYAMPAVDTIFDRLGKARFFSVVDANKGYYQFLLDRDSRDLTGFITFRGLRRYRRMPFGLKQAPGWFQKAMDRVLGSAQWQFAMAYLDDIVIYSATFHEHLTHLDTVLSALERAGLTISPSKCRFAYESVALLGYKVSSLGLMTDEEKTRAVLEFPEPESAAEARRFFAMAAWYRRFISDFAARARPINKSFVGQDFVWGETERAAFRDLKRAITSSPVLARPDFERPFILAVDASKQGLGGVLLQADEHGAERPLLFVSRQTTDGEKKYAPTHLELAAVWWCVRKLHHYIDGSSVEIRTDHNALRWLWDLKPSDISEPRVQKFKMALAPLEHKVKISYHRGKDNVVADALSRAPVPDRSGTEGGVELRFVAREYERLPERELEAAAEETVRSTSLLRMGAEELESWGGAYAADPRWRRIWRRAQDRMRAVSEDDGLVLLGPVAHGEPGLEPDERVDTQSDTSTAAEEQRGQDDDRRAAEDTSAPEPTRKDTAPARRTLRPRRVLAVHRGEDSSIYFVKDGLLFVRLGDQVRLCVPQAKLADLVHEYHTSIRSAHPSAERTYDVMKDHIFAHGLGQFISSHVRTCYECQVNKVPRHKPYGELEPIVTENEVFHTCGIDFVTGLPKTAQGHDSIMVVADKYSRFAFFLPNSTSDSAEDVARRFLNSVFPVTGLPKALISDRDPKFTSTFWSTLMKELDVKLAMSTAFHAQTDGLVERLNAQLETMLRHYVALDQHDWDTKLPALAMAYNSQKQESTEQSPYKLVFNREPTVFPLRELARSADPTHPKVGDIFAIHADAQAAMEVARERQRQAYNAKHQPMEFQEGDAVLISLKNYRFDLDPTEQARAKLGPRFAGPYRVKRRIGRLAYELEVPAWFKAHPVLPITALEPFKGNMDEVQPRTQVGTAASGGEIEVRVLGFVGRRPTRLTEGHTFDYLVKWAGPAPTWQCDTRLPGLEWARKEFERRARSELNFARLRKTSTIILPEAKQRWDELEAAEQEDAARTPGSPLGGEVVADSQTGGDPITMHS